MPPNIFLFKILEVLNEDQGPKEARKLIIDIETSQYKLTVLDTTFKEGKIICKAYMSI
jgi:hypothetical protein